jgi:hypothetical protein
MAGIFLNSPAPFSGRSQGADGELENVRNYSRGRSKNGSLLKANCIFRFHPISCPRTYVWVAAC